MTPIKSPHLTPNPVKINFVAEDEALVMYLLDYDPGLYHCVTNQIWSQI